MSEWNVEIVGPRPLFWGCAGSLTSYCLSSPVPQHGTYSQVSRTACGMRRRSWVKPRTLPGTAEGMAD
jgi:hypothetical protein